MVLAIRLRTHGHLCAYQLCFGGPRRRRGAFRPAEAAPQLTGYPAPRLVLQPRSGISRRANFPVTAAFYGDLTYHAQGPAGTYCRSALRAYALYLPNSASLPNRSWGLFLAGQNMIIALRPSDNDLGVALLQWAVAGHTSFAMVRKRLLRSELS